MNNKIINICIILEKLKKKTFVVKVYKNCTNNEIQMIYELH